MSSHMPQQEQDDTRETEPMACTVSDCHDVPIAECVGCDAPVCLLHEPHAEHDCDYDPTPEYVNADDAPMPLPTDARACKNEYPAGCARNVDRGGSGQ